MIPVQAATFEAMCQPTVKVTPRLRLYLDGGDRDVSNRLLQDPMIHQRVGPFLDMARDVGQTFTLDNSDGWLTPADRDGSVLKGKLPGDYYMSELQYDIGITRADETIEYVNVYTGVLTDIACPQVGVIELEAASRWGFGMEQATSREIILNGYLSVSWASGEIQSAYTRTNAVCWPAVGPFQDGSWAAASQMALNLDWHISGRLREGTAVGSVAHLLAASQGCQITPLENGYLRISPIMLPAQIGFGPWYVPHSVSEEDATNWRFSRPVDLGATEIVVTYQGTSIRYRDKTHESRAGRLVRTIAAPYCAFGRQAQILARVGYEQHGSFPIVLSFVTGPRGLLYQLNDWVEIRDPFTNTKNWYRITGKQVRFGSVGIEATLDGHRSSVVEEDFIAWGSSAWSSQDYWL